MTGKNQDNPQQNKGSENVKESEKSQQMSAVEIQQQYYEAIGDADWELYEKKDRKFLLQKVALALIGPPTGEGDLVNSGDEMELQGYPSLRDKENVMAIFKKICKQAKYSHNGENIIISVLRILCVIPTQELGFMETYPDDYWLNLHLKKGKENVTILVFHVFAIRKCIAMKSGLKSCRMFIDHDGRVYHSWNSYLKENKLPKCVMVVPYNGEYKGELVATDATGEISSEMPRVKLSVVASPALGIRAKILEVTDRASIGLTVASLAGVAGAALLAPVALPTALSALLVTGVATGVVSIVRSSINLDDRKKHDQGIGLDDPEARSYWINIAISSVGLTFTAAGKLLAMAAASGTSVEMFINAVQFLKYTNNATSAIGVLNGLGEMAYKYGKYGEKPTMSDYFQVSVSALFFGIGVMSNQTAKDIVQNAQAEKINSVRESLASNTKRKIFDKVTAETRRLRGYISGNSDIIRALDKIENKDDFFAKLGRINKQINKNNMRISLTSDAKTLVNNEYSFSLSKLYKLGKAGRNDLFTKLGSAKVDSKNAPTRISSTNNPTIVSATATDNYFGIRGEEMAKITCFLLKLSKIDTEFIAEILSKITKKIHEGFLLLCSDIVLTLMPKEQELLKSLWPNFEIHLALFIYNYFKSSVTDVKETDNALVTLMKTFIKNGKIDKNSVETLKSKFLYKVEEIKNSFYDDPNKYDDFQNFCSTNKQFLSLHAGDVIKLDDHEILVKSTTIEMFEARLKKYNQLQCDMLIAVIFQIITNLTTNDAMNLIMINPDEDLVMRVAKCVFQIADIDELTARLSESEEGITNADIAMFLRNFMLQIWKPRQKISDYTNCEICQGIKYAE